MLEPDWLANVFRELSPNSFRANLSAERELLGKPAGAVHYRICRRRLLAVTTQAIGLKALAAKGEHMIKPERPATGFRR